MSDGFKIVSSRLLDSEVGVDGSVSGGSCETFVLPVFDVFPVSSNVALSKTEIYDVYLRGL